MNSNRHRDEKDQKPRGLPDQDTGVPTPDPEEIRRMELDLRSNAENDWQDEMPDGSRRGSRRQPERSSHKRTRTTDEGDTDDEPNGGFGDGDSARTGGG